MDDLSKSIQSYFFVAAEETALATTSSDFERSQTATLSPGFKVYDGMFTTSPFTVICLCPTNCRAPFLVGDTPIRYTTLSSLASQNCGRSSPVIPVLRDRKSV